MKRGIYSNEAGQGTAPHAAAAAEVSHPAKQGLVQAFSIYIDTLFVCSATAFMILITGMYNVIPEGAAPIVNNLGDVSPGPDFTIRAVETFLPGFGAPFIAIALLFFAFTTIMAYYYMAETNLAYINQKTRRIWAEFALKLVILFATFYGSVKTASLAWGLGDIGVGSMAWLNIIAILLLTKPALKVLRDYEAQKKKAKTPYSIRLSWASRMLSSGRRSTFQKYLQTRRVTTHSIFNHTCSMTTISQSPHITV